jgi:hypothetical protein
MEPVLVNELPGLTPRSPGSAAVPEMVLGPVFVTVELARTPKGDYGARIVP